jgi:hypothetical protein
MQYNIHPLFVHFPIALLFLYSVIKIIPFKKWFPDSDFKVVEMVLLLFGFLGACMALFTGETAEHIVQPARDLVEMHSFFANISTYIYGTLLVGELSSLVNKNLSETSQSFIRKISLFLEKVLCNKYFSILLSILGLICISTAGLLGGVMVYGLTADPVAPFVLHLLGLSV